MYHANEEELPMKKQKFQGSGFRAFLSLSTVHRSLFALLLLAALAPRAEAVSATGGTVTNYTDADGTWRAHIFTNTAATSIVFSVGGNVEVLVVGGGGAGRGNGDGVNSGSGGDAGQLIYVKGYSVDSVNMAVTVGMGGTGVPAASGGSGSNSVFGTITAKGGAGGTVGSNSQTYGGRGAGGAGSGPGTGPTGNAGGSGVTNSITGTATAYAGGGGGGNTTGANGGSGGGGLGETYGNGNATAGTDGLGGGGGGVSSAGSNPGKNGGSGTVIVRYIWPSVSVTAPINSFFANGTTSISATAAVYGDYPPFTVKFYTNSASGSYAQAGNDQGPNAGPSFSVAVTGFANNSTNHIYAVVVDNAGRTNTSSINTFFMVPNNLPISPYKAFCVGDVPSIFTNNVGRIYAVHQYTNTANFGYFVPSTSIKNIDVLLVAGGGGGGYLIGGGGGGGGLIWTSLTVTAQGYPVVIGKGGDGATSASGTGWVGSNSTFNSLVAYGGGGGGGYNNAYTAPTTGGSGGGGSHGGSGNLGATNGAAGISGQGYAGGNGTWESGYNAGGGGGAGTNGWSGTSTTGGTGGVGRVVDITGASVYYGGGGGGGGNAGKSAGPGGLGGGGTGSVSANGQDGANSFGGGGGGGGQPSKLGGAGGSGIVIIRYDITPPKGTLFMMR
jgi:hypothetical protein